MFCYVGGGWYWPGQTIQDLQDEMRRHLDAGYTMVKMKVGGLPLADDLRRLEAVLEVVGSGEHLAVDANCKFDRAEALAYAKALAPFKLRWFEEPCDPLDFALMAELADVYAPPLATGENLYSTQDVENLVRFGGLRAGRDVIQIDPPQAYGIAQYATHAGRCWQGTAGRARRCSRTAATRCRSRSPPASASAARSPIPACSAISAALPTTPVSKSGVITLSDRPGIGFEGQQRLFRIMRELAGI